MFEIGLVVLHTVCFLQKTTGMHQQAVLAPPGHMQPIGSHTPPMSIEERNDFPDPIELFDNYVSPGKPVLFKGAAKKFPSYYNWKNDTYLKEKYGSWEAKVETIKKGYMEREPTMMNLSKFIDIYKTESVYLVDTITPPEPITGDVFVPRPVLCKAFLDNLVSIVLWFSSGGTRPVLHNDAFENINCLYDGEKEFVLVDKKHKDLVPIDHPSPNSPHLGYSSVDTEQVDMYKYPSLTKVPWYKANMETGDCLFLPARWYHHVHSLNSRNLAINLWWKAMPELEHRDECEKKVSGLPQYESLIQHRLKNGVKLEELVFAATFNGSSEIEETKFYRITMLQFPDLKSTKDRIPLYRKLKNFFITADSNTDKKLTRNEVETAPIEVLDGFFLSQKPMPEKDEPLIQDEL
nr:jmjC domain-containing protein 5-like [Ciona intestinalis]|eukprot:XP_002126999.2 jmjC domain-containing protein 5-like [Ciona intestinalis]